ncbi:MAG: hypothetical protein DWQ07_01285 [Chloroflexi bacterium]|nr:MAG: hypothetical protein DWQ07_01285 [Chloroflexota bacterium]MBL1196484.1 hypothetical protein [Chloroflexota bacterium]NOH13779.1 hypothetical protein [Chloroflexota bacterium]
MKVQDILQYIQNQSTHRIIGVSTVFFLVSIILIELLFFATSLGNDDVKAAIYAFIVFPLGIINGALIAIRQEFPFMENKNLLEGPSAFLVGCMIVLGSLILLAIVISSIMNGPPTLNGNVS